MNSSVYANIYNEIFDVEMKKLLLNLKNIFIQYYGQKNEQKINTIFNNLTIIYISKNDNINTIETKINETSKFYFSLINKFNNQISSEQAILDYALSPKTECSSKIFDFRKKFFYYSYQIFFKNKKINNIDYSIYLNSNRKINSETIALSRNVKVSSAHTHITEKDGYLTFIEITNGLLPLHSIIHEINHHLQKELSHKIIYDNKKEETYLINGITNDENDLINELINEYVSKDILNLYIRLCHNKWLIFDEK